MYPNIKRFPPCLNCSRSGHEQKYCHDPITSWGIILVKFGEGYNPQNHYDSDLNNYENTDGFRLFSKNDLSVVTQCMENIKFLLVRRRHSLGFAEFIRGKYVVGNINGIRTLIKQMVPEEIEMLRNNSFEQLWEYFWGSNNALEILNKKDFHDSKDKFTKLKSKISVECDLDWYLDTVTPDYFLPEWGFPKGRKKKEEKCEKGEKKVESDLSCALREFCEETGLSDSDINILNMKPIKEELLGTNGVKYRHIYFLAEMKSETPPLIINSEKEHSEIGDIGFFSFDNSLELLRDYHIKKKLILQRIMCYYMDMMKSKVRDKENEWRVEDSDE
jgi:8-oxo-dGTP pyrophosphatase MutT (NUDIX family)